MLPTRMNIGVSNSTLPMCTPGDMNFVGEVNVGDMLLLQRSSLGI